MPLSETEKQQVEAAVDAFLESPNVQTAITGVVATAEAEGIQFADDIINNAKVGGLLGTVVNAFKGSAVAELNTLVASLPPAALTMLATKAVESELKSILGA